MTRGIYVKGRAYSHRSEKIPIRIYQRKEKRESAMCLPYKENSQLVLMHPILSIFAPNNFTKLTNSNGLLHPRQFCLIQLRCIPGHDCLLLLANPRVARDSD